MREILQPLDAEAPVNQLAVHKGNTLQCKLKKKTKKTSHKADLEYGKQDPLEGTTQPFLAIAL